MFAINLGTTLNSHIVSGTPSGCTKMKWTCVCHNQNMQGNNQSLQICIHQALWLMWFSWFRTLFSWVLCCISISTALRRLRQEAYESTPAWYLVKLHHQTNNKNVSQEETPPPPHGGRGVFLDVSSVWASVPVLGLLWALPAGPAPPWYRCLGSEFSRKPAPVPPVARRWRWSGFYAASSSAVGQVQSRCPSLRLTEALRLKTHEGGRKP